MKKTFVVLLVLFALYSEAGPLRMALSQLENICMSRSHSVSSRVISRGFSMEKRQQFQDDSSVYDTTFKQIKSPPRAVAFLTEDKCHQNFRDSHIMLQKKEQLSLMTLNVWGGHVQNPLQEFFRKNKEVDLFCVQELYKNAPRKMSTDDLKVDLSLSEKIQRSLPDHELFFCPVLEDWYGIGIFIKKSFTVLDYGEKYIYINPYYENKGPAHNRKLQWLKTQTPNGDLITIVNIHGLWNGKGKGDSADRLQQSYLIQKFIKTISTPYVMCGDFNLRPDTKSLQILKCNLRDLIQENNITSTRTSFYKKAERFADYLFTTPHNINVDSLSVLPDEVSDHNALRLNFNVTSVKKHVV